MPVQATRLCSNLRTDSDGAHHVSTRVRAMQLTAEPSQATRSSKKGTWMHAVTIRLPLEILTAIVNELDDLQDVRNVRMASHALCAAATPTAFPALSVIATKRSAQNLGQLFNIPDIAAHVRKVSFHDMGTTDRKGRTLNYGASSLCRAMNNHELPLHLRWRVMSVRSHAVHELASSFSRIHQLSRLETIKLTFNSTYDDSNRVDSNKGSRLALQASILDALAASFGVCIPPKLTLLSIQNLRPSDFSSLESPPFQKFLKTMPRLQLSVLFDSFPPRDTFYERWCDFWSSFCPRMILAPAQHSLTELTLHSDIFLHASSGMSLAGLHFPRLCALSLRNFDFDPPVGVKPFILRHAATLGGLELLACKLTHLGPFTALGLWETIWDQFAEELISLVVLRIDRPEYSNIPSGNRLPCFPTDFAALERFRAAVATRSEMRGTLSEERGSMTP